MSKKLEIFKKKLIYRASYRGTKEMDILLTNFVKKFIDKFNEKELYSLEKFLEFDDEIISNFYNYNIVSNNIDKNLVSKTFKNFKI
jgi:Uncharacterized conserved protein